MCVCERESWGGGVTGKGERIVTVTSSVGGGGGGGEENATVVFRVFERNLLPKVKERGKTR